MVRHEADPRGAVQAEDHRTASRQQGRSKVRPLHLVSSFYDLVRVRARQRRVLAPNPTVCGIDDASSEAARYPTS
jgi:hypothetical protein